MNLLRIFNFPEMPAYTRHIKYISFMLLTVFADNLFADNTYPMSVSNKSYIEGGRYVISEFDSDKFISYFLKPGWNNKSETIYTWRGTNREDTKAANLNNRNVISALGLEGGLFTIEKESNRIFISLYDSLLKVNSLTEIFTNNDEQSILEVNWLQIIGSKVLFTINKELFITDFNGKLLRANFISDDIITGSVTNDGIIYYIKQFSSNCELYRFAYGSETFLARLPLLHNGNIMVLSDTIYISIGNKGESQSLLMKLSLSGEVLFNSWIGSSPELLKFSNNIDSPVVLYPEFVDGKIKVIIADVLGNNLKVISEITIPDGFSKVLKINSKEGLIYLLFSNGLIIADFDGSIQAADLFPVGHSIGDSPNIKVIDDELFILSDNASFVLVKKGNYFWLFYSFFQTSGKFLLPGFLLFIIIVLVQIYRHQKRFLDEILSHPFAGIIIFIDKSGKIKKINDLGRKLFGISNNIPLNKPYGFYFLKDEIKPFKEMINEAFITKEVINKRLSIVTGTAVKEWYCSITPIRNITGNFRGLIFAGIDITEQLERKRLSNWAQLAHDMQTSLSTIRLNAELLEADLNSENINRRVRIIYQVNLLIQRVRDIVTVGRSDIADLREISSEELCREVCSEFDPQLFPDVEFKLDLSNFLLKADKAKLARALRNAIENGIKSLYDKKGLIEIKCWRDGRSACFGIRDYGKGMDNETKQNMLKPYFTTSKDGKGFGIGTMIMQQAVEQHKGEMIINSENNNGTEIVFKIPLLINRPGA